MAGFVDKLVTGVAKTMAAAAEKRKPPMTPQEYFDTIKGKKHEVTDEVLDNVYNNCLELAEKYSITGQTAGLKKLTFHMECIEREREVVKAGVSTFVYRDDIENFIENVADKAVKIITLEEYPREIPDEIVEVLKQVGKLFDQCYVVFTDYTGKIEKQVATERRAKDPILFGTFQDAKSRTVVDRFYYLGDWVDEYCDLTLDKLVNLTREKTGKSVAHNVSTPKTLDDLKRQLNNLEERPDGDYIVVEKPLVAPIDVSTGLKRDE